MNVRLFNDNGCETPNQLGEWYADWVHSNLKEIVEGAVENNVSLRDLETMVVDHISSLTAQKRIRKGIDESRKKRQREKDFKAGQDFYEKIGKEKKEREKDLGA